MTDEMVYIENLPDVRDINVLLEAIKEIGAVVERVSTDRSKNYRILLFLISVLSMNTSRKSEHLITY